MGRKYIFIAALLCVTGACRGKHHRTTVENEEPATATPRLASTLKMNDPAAPTQLLKGFYGVEGGSWRWSAGHFTILLRSPVGAAQRGGTLSLAFTVPDVVIQKLNSVTLTASIGAAKLKSETYSKSGAYTFTAEVPAEVLAKDSVTIDFSLDKFLPAGAVDQRELGIIVTAAGLEGK